MRDTTNLEWASLAETDAALLSVMDHGGKMDHFSFAAYRIAGGSRLYCVWTMNDEPRWTVIPVAALEASNYLPVA